jgi:hypothetical protein
VILNTYNMRKIDIPIVVLSLIISLFLSCCKNKLYDDEFVLDKTKYTGNQLKIDGYYYSPVENEDFFSLYVFYRNGIVLIPGVCDNPEECLAEFKPGSALFKYKYSWGLFLIDSNSISIEYYIPKMIEGMPAYIAMGDIINDTTFIIKEIKRSKNNSVRQLVNETYHYKQFSLKPDSTNIFLK